MTSYLITLGSKNVFLTNISKTAYGIVIKFGINNINKKLQLSKYFVTSYLVTLSPNNVFLTYFNLYLPNDLRYYDET